VYSATVPGSAFVPDRGGTRYLYWIPEGATPVYNGLQKLLLVMNGDSVDIVAKGLIPPGEELVPAAFTASAAPKSSSSSPTYEDTTLAWAMHLFNGCVSDPTLECKKWRRYLAWCR